MAFTTPGTAVAGSVLTSAFWNTNVRDNTNYLKDEADAVGLVHIFSADLPSAGALSVNNCFSASFFSYRVLISYTAASTALQTFMKLRAGTDNSANYFTGGSLVRETGVTSTLNISNGGNGFQIGSVNTAGVLRCSASIDLNGPFEVRPTAGSFTSSSNDATSFFGSGGGLAHSNSSSFDGFSVIVTTGTIAANVKVYGYRN
jgi:hypothetical protein